MQGKKGLYALWKLKPFFSLVTRSGMGGGKSHEVGTGSKDLGNIAGRVFFAFLLIEGLILSWWRALHVVVQRVVC